MIFWLYCIAATTSRSGGYHDRGDDDTIEYSGSEEGIFEMTPTTQSMTTSSRMDIGAASIWIYGFTSSLHDLHESGVYDSANLFCFLELDTFSWLRYLLTF